MTYDESMQATVTREEAKSEIEAHGFRFEDFAAECGDRGEYAGSDVLGWLGY